MLLADKTVGRFVPVRFFFYSAVGFIGLVLHASVLLLALKGMNVGFVEAQNLATGVAMVSNFFLNNSLTYSDRRLRGWSILRGFILFSLICSVAWIANLATAEFLYDLYAPGWETWLFAGIAGALVSAVWNYAVSSVIVWKRG